jgi:hypothetical protein
MKTKLTKIEGYFDVRIYNATLPREQWQVKSANDVIAFVSKNLELTEGGEFLKTIEKQDGSTYTLAKFKIGKNCKFYDSHAKAIERPQPAELDGKRFEVNLVYNVLPKDEKQPTKACGLWVDAIMLHEIEANPFAEFADEIVTPAPAPAVAVADTADKLPNVRYAQDDSGLPF